MPSPKKCIKILVNKLNKEKDTIHFTKKSHTSITVICLPTYFLYMHVPVSLILVDSMHFLKHCPLVSVADKRYIYLFPFQFITWTACFSGSDTGRIEMRFLSTVPWCLLQLSNHSPLIKHMMFYYLSRLLCWIRHGENQNTILKHRPLVSPPAK